MIITDVVGVIVCVCVCVCVCVILKVLVQPFEMV